MKNKGFTLIELLAVIVILAIIALIATPIILNIIGDTKDSSVVRSGELYLSAVESAIARENLKGQFNPNTCEIQNDGNLSCLDKDNNIISLKIETTGSRPTAGTITLTNGKISKVENMLLDGYTLKQEDGKLVAELSNDNNFEFNPQGTYLMKSSFSLEDINNITFLDGPIKRSEIESVTIKNTKKVPSNAIASWDVSEKKDGSVMAWYTDTDSNNLYELYIGGDGGVKANPDSSYLFSFLTNTTIIHLQYLDTSDVINMNCLFSYSGKLNLLDLSTFDTSKVTGMFSVFGGCNSLKEVVLSSFNTEQVETMQYMFAECSSLTNLNISTFDTSNVITMESMFSGCSSLTSLNVSNFDTSRVTNMYGMFENCDNLETIDMRNFDFTSIATYDNIFTNNSKLTTLYVKDEFAQNFVNERLSEVQITGVNVEIFR